MKANLIDTDSDEVGYGSITTRGQSHNSADGNKAQLALEIYSKVHVTEVNLLI